MAQELDCSERVSTVDIRARTVAGVLVDLPVDSLEQTLGAAGIRDSVEYLEGEPSPLHVLQICGHRLFRHWNGLSWHDESLETLEGARVGMLVSAFDSRYGQGRPIWTEAGIVVSYPVDQREFFAVVDQQCTSESATGEPTLQSRECAVLGVWIPLQTLPD